MNTPLLTYRGYTARVEFSTEDDALVGRLVTDPAGEPLRDVVSFHGQSVADVRAALAEAVDDYVEMVQARGEQPVPAASGRLALRMPPELHRKVRQAAAHSGQSINAFIVEQLAKAA